jgi:hypothetical protein
MDTSPITMMSTIHPLSGEDSLVLRMGKHPGNISTNANGAHSSFLPGELQKEFDIPVIVDAYNQHTVGVNVADQYETYFDSQLISRFNSYQLFYWMLETGHRQKCKSSRHCATRTSAHAQLIASVPWTPLLRAANSHL